MNPILTATALAAAIALSGCAGLTTMLNTEQSDTAIGARVLQDIQGCTRHYNGSLGATGVQGSFTIDCDPRDPPPAVPLSQLR